MKKCIITIAVLMFTIVSAAYGQNESIYSFKVKDANGTEVSLEGYKGKVLLIVNTATRCGFTPQYTQLEEMSLYNYLKSKKGNADNPNIRWNFTKFLISKDGEVLQRFEPGDSMDKVDAAVAELLK